MTAYSDSIFIKHTELNSANWVSCNGTVFIPSYKRRTSIKPKDGQFSGTSPAYYAIAAGDNVGVENPAYELRGAVNLDHFSTIHDVWNPNPSTLTGSVANEITLAYLINISRVMTGSVYVRLALGDIPNQTLWHNHDLTSTDILVKIDSIAPVPMEDAEGRHLILFTISCQEISSE